MLKKFKGLKHTEKIIRKMCNVVGADINKIDFTKPDWYTKYKWSEEEQEKFTTWLSEYLYDNSEARKELMAMPIKDKKTTNGAARIFMLNYGWKLS